MKKMLQLLLICFVVSVAAMAQKSTSVEIVELNAQTFKQKVWDFDKDRTFNRIGKVPIILDFHATWCRPCKMLAPHLQAIQDKYKGKLVIYKIDVDKDPELAKRFNVQAMPTVVFIGSKTKYNTELGYKELDQVEVLVKKYFFGNN